MRNFFKFYSFDCDASTATEYALIAAGIALTIAAVLFAFGDSFVEMLDAMAAALAQAFG
ncbi:MAG: hypothetical protein DHS20C02_08230 [Micavibrio sp.]|nr:MAG: hypothetical protein DHS20C02_08230 [Micavibrio sp.]